MDYIILDSPLSDGKVFLVEMIASSGLPTPIAKYIIGCGDMVSRLTTGVGYEQLNAVPVIANTEVPILILHSLTDSVCPYYMAEELYAGIPDDVSKQLYAFDQIKHIEMFYEAREEYMREILKFIERK